MSNMKRLTPAFVLISVLLVPSLALADKVEVIFSGIPSKVKFSGGATGTIKVKGNRATFQFRGAPPTKVCGVVAGKSACKALSPGQRYETF